MCGLVQSKAAHDGNICACNDDYGRSVYPDTAPHATQTARSAPKMRQCHDRESENALRTQKEAVLNVRSQLPTELQRHLSHQENAIARMDMGDLPPATSTARLAIQIVDTH